MAYIDELFQALIENGASDLHLAEGQPAKIRRHGEIVPIWPDSPPLTREQMAYMLSEICTPEKWQKYEECGDLDFAYQMDENSRFRCNYLKQAHGYGAVFRIIPTKILTLEQLNVPEVIKEFGDMRGGIVLVTGPTGSGKSTTLAALIDYINTNYGRHIVTI
jgi:twitching motility protein PilT